MNNKKIFYGLVGFVTIVLLSLSMIMIGRESKKQDVRLDTPTFSNSSYTPVYPPTPERDLFYDEFMKGCDKDGTKTSYCQCTFNNLQANYTRTQLVNFGLNIESKEANDAVMSAASSCIHLVK